MYERNASLKLLEEISELISEIRRLLVDSPDPSRDQTRIAALIRNLREELHKRTWETNNVFSDRTTFPSKEEIVDFVQTFYHSNIPLRWTRKEIEQEAVVVSGYDGARALRANIGNYLEFKNKKQLVDIFSMSPSDIEKVFSNVQKYPNVTAIKKALPMGFRSLLKGVRVRETAIRKIIRETDRIKGVHKIYDIFAERDR